MATSALMDLLAQETQKLTQQLSDKKLDNDYDKSKETIKEIQIVIQSRNETTTSNSFPVNFTEPDSTL